MLAERMSRVSTSPTMKVAGEAAKLKRQGVDVVDFGAGEPDFPTPQPAKDAAKVAIDQNFTKYTPPAGTPDLRQAICARYLADYGVAFSEAECIVTAGGKQALYNTAMVLYNPGDEVITHAPYWPTIPEQVKLADATPVIVQTKAENGFAIHPDAVIAAITPRTKAIIINSPANPTGAVISEEDLAAIADAAAKRGIWVVVDLCYEKLIYDNVPHNLAKVLTDRMRDRAILCGSASKAYSMTGWRCGWILGPKEVVTAADTLQGHSTSNVASISQKAALQALTGSQDPVGAMLSEYKTRRDKLMEWFSEDPRFECVKPRGAFYLFPRITKVLEAAGIANTGDFSQMLLDEARVALAAGEGFDAPGFLRISYATSLDRLREGTTRILDFVKKHERKATRHPNGHPTAQNPRGGGPPARLPRWGPRQPFDSVTRLPSGFTSRAAGIVGGPFVLQDLPSRETYGTDGTKQGTAADLVVLPGSTRDVSQIAKLCNDERVPIVARGAGTGYTGGAVPTRGGVVLSLERMNRILEIDQVNLLARVQPNVITGDLQDAVEKVGLFYPPDPASLRQSALGGNVAECAGGPRAFKYGTTKRYVLALEAVLADGQVIHTGSKAVKNVVGYDLTQLLVGSEGTLAIITEITLRLIPKPAARATLVAEFADITHAVDAVTGLIHRRVVPAAVELVDAASLKALAEHAGRPMAAPGAGAALIIEVDGSPESVGPDILLVEDACREASAIQLKRAATEAERDDIWQLRRELSPALKKISTIKLNNDVVVPRGRIPELFALVKEIERDAGLPIASFGHAGDGNIHVNIMIPESGQNDAMARGEQAVRRLFEGVVALEGSISGEHGIGFTKSAYLGLELSPEEIALMKRVKAAFDPNGILNPGKIFPDG